MIKTTINMHDKTLKTLEYASSKLNVSQMDVIKLLLGKIHLDRKKYIKLFTIIKYQKRDPENNWSCMHITFTSTEYEHFIDMRKFFKKSLSNIIAFAARKYLKIILKKYNNTKWDDNNHPSYFEIYSFNIKMFREVEYRIISWNLPKEYT